MWMLNISQLEAGNSLKFGGVVLAVSTY